MIALIIALYLLGFPSFYLSWRGLHRKYIGKWTKGDRAKSFFLCLFSWLGFFITVLLWACEASEDKEKASW